LFFIAMTKQRSHGVHLRVACRRDPARTVDLFQDNAGFGDAESSAAVLFRDQRCQPTEFR
jgi:hypothetical protein